MEVGKRYRIRKDVEVQERFKGKRITVKEITYSVVHVKLDDDEQIYNININVWKEMIEDVTSWQDNVLLHKFI